MKTKTIISIVVYAVLLVVVLGVVAFVFAYINNGQKNFYVQYGDEKISHKLENVELEKNATSLFYCKNVLGITDKQEQATNFTVRVQANSEALSEYDFTGFTLDGKTKDFFKGTDITNGFYVVSARNAHAYVRARKSISRRGNCGRSRSGFVCERMFIAYCVLRTGKSDGDNRLSLRRFLL